MLFVSQAVEGRVSTREIRQCECGGSTFGEGGGEVVVVSSFDWERGQSGGECAMWWESGFGRDGRLSV